MGDLRSAATWPITQTVTGPDRNLEILVRRLHNVVSLAVLVLLGLLAPALGDQWWPTLLLIGGILGIGRSRLSTTWLLLADLVASVWLWWLFGPVSGAPFIPYAVVSLAPLILAPSRSRTLIAFSVATVPVEVMLHLASGGVELPLFHPPGPIPQGEFFIGSAIQAALLMGVGLLMWRLAQALAAGREAMGADLTRQRELHILKDKFLATVSHELRTPLTALRGFARLLHEEHPSVAERNEYVGLLVDQAEGMHYLIEDLITFNRIQSDQLTVKPQPVNLQRAVKSVINALGDRGRAVVNEVRGPIMVMADPIRLDQVLRNLVDNALKYGCDPVVISSGAVDGWVHCHVSDGGPGLQPSQADAAFEPYSRFVDNSTMSEPGLGVGLAVVRGLVEAHGGWVSYVSPTEGFEVRLPEAPEIDEPQSSLVPQSSERIPQLRPST